MTSPTEHPGKVIALVQPEFRNPGGVGCSTIATNIAGALASSGFRVALWDANVFPSTSTAWTATRSRYRLAEQLEIWKDVPAQRMMRFHIWNLMASCDYIVIDADFRHSAVAAFVSHLCLLPLGRRVSSLVGEYHRLLLEIRGIGSNNTFYGTPLSAKAVWNSPRESYDWLHYYLPRGHGLSVMSSALSDRPAYADALSNGRTVLEGTDPVAREEMGQMVAEILAELSSAK